MEKSEWLHFFNTRRQSQISADTSARLQGWGLILLSLATFSYAFTALKNAGSYSFIVEAKVLFLTVFHLLAVITVWLPSIVEKDAKPLARTLQIHDSASSVFNGITILLVLFIANTLSFQLFKDISHGEKEAFFHLVLVFNAVLTAGYLTAAAIAGILYFSAPQTLLKMGSKGSALIKTLAVTQGILFLLLGFNYLQGVALGSAVFFEEFALVSALWIGLTGLILFVARLQQESPLEEISALEMDITSGKLSDDGDILVRYKEVFTSRRLRLWVSRLHHTTAQKAEEIAAYCREALQTVAADTPTEFDLRKVEDNYRRADFSYQKLEKENIRYQLLTGLFDSSESELNRIHSLQDFYSRQLRNSKLELASVRKKIDEKLVQLKNSAAPQPQTEVKVEKLPVSR